VPGITLASVPRPLSQRAAHRVGGQIARALEALHKADLRHYDLKPENVVLRRGSKVVDHLTQAILIDLSFRDERQQGALSDVSLQYVAPELLRGESADGRADLWALGVLCYHLLTDRLPFTAKSVAQIIQKQQARDFVPIGDVRSGLNAGLARLIDALLEPHSENRPGSAQEVLALLEACQPAEEPVAFLSGDPSSSVVGREHELDRCLAVLTTGGSRANALLVAGRSGFGVTTFLRELQDRVEALNAVVLTLQPRELCGASFRRQLETPVDNLVRQSGGAIPADPDPRQTAHNSDLLDDLFIAAHGRHVIVFVDDMNECDTSELTFLRRLVLQNKARHELGGSSLEGQCHLVCGLHEYEPRTLMKSYESTLFDDRIDLQPITEDGLRVLAKAVGVGERLSRLDCTRIHTATEGVPRRANHVLRSLADKMRHGWEVRNALDAAVMERPDNARAIAECDAVLAHTCAAVTALLLWAEPMTGEEWQRIVRRLGPSPAEQQSQYLVESSKTGVVVANRRFVTAQMWHRLEHQERDELCRAVLQAVAGRWRSHAPDALVPVCRFVARMGYMPRTGTSRLLRALMVLGRRGRWADIDTVTTMFMQSHAKVPWWIRLFNRAAKSETGQTIDGDEYLAHHSEGETECFYSSWLEARKLRRARHRKKAGELLKALVESDRDAPMRARAALLEDYALVTIEQGAPDEAQEARRSLARHIRPWLRVNHDRKTWRRHQWRMDRPAHFYRVSYAMSFFLGRYGHALVCCRKERALQKLQGNRMRESQALNNEGAVLIRRGEFERAVAILGKCAARKEELDDECGLVVVLNNLSIALSGAGRISAAAGVLNRAKVVAARNGLSRHRNLSMLNLGLAYVRTGQIREARRTFRRVARLSLREGDSDARIRALYNCGRSALDSWCIPVVRGYIARLRRSMATCGWTRPLDLELEAELCVRLEDWSGLTDVLAKSDNLKESQFYRSVVTIQANPAKAPSEKRLSATERLRLMLHRMKAQGRRVGPASLDRILKLAQSRALLREALEWVTAFAVATDNGEAAIKVGCRTLARREFKEGHEDLRATLAAYVAKALLNEGRYAEAWRLVQEALNAFAALDRKVRRWARSSALLEAVATSVENALGTCSANTNMSASRVRLRAAAFDVFVRSGRNASGQAAVSIGTLSDTFAAGFGSRPFVESLLEVLVSAKGSQRAIVVIGDPKKRKQVYAIHRIEPAEGQPSAPKISWAVVGHVCATGTPCFYGDALTADELTSHRSIATLELRSLACVPISIDNGVVGALYSDHQGIAGLFSDADLPLFEAIASLTGASLQLERSKNVSEEVRQELADAHRHLLRAERSRLVGEITSGIAHDLKNVLTAIVARSQLLQQSGALDTAMKAAKSIEMASFAGAELIQRLQDCSRDHSLQAEEDVSVLDIANEALELLRPRLAKQASRGAVIASTGGAQAARTRAVPGELRELFLNLFANACDAMPDGGELEIAVDSCPDEREVYATVSDSGLGMAESVRQRIFEPFFTTKGSKGTGLGLAVVRSIVVRYGGSISVTSQPSRGTTFHVTLPLVTDHAPASGAGRREGEFLGG